MPKPVTPADGVAWITGASTGIGRETARRLAAAGWTVAVTARGADGLATLAAEAPAGRIVPMPGDVTDPAAMAAIVGRIEAEIGPLALALLNAGTYKPLKAATMQVADFRDTFAVNVDGTINALVPAVAAMQGRGRGQVAIVSSVAGYGGLPGAAAYSASKAALIKMAESLKFDLDRLGILIQVINPGFVETPLTAKNDFPMPFLMPVDAAADRILRGLSAGRFEIVFPRRFAAILKLLNALPYGLYFRLVARSTGWR
jgi:NAD(P)-dependent dehydrogenase (short-subunit alcohol dehydrogenase family)